MSYDRDTGLAATWATSVDHLSLQSRRLLDRLAMLAADPVPDSLLDVAVPGETVVHDAYEARAGLYAYSLITRASGAEGPAKGFVMHRLVQDFARRAMNGRRGEVLVEALGWMHSAFAGDPQDARSWPVLDPLAPHALAVAQRADDAGIAEPTGAVFVMLDLLLNAKARFAEAEPLSRRALAISEATLPARDAELAARLNNLANLLQGTNRAGEAERLYRRALAITEESYGPNDPHVATQLSNLANLLLNTNCLNEAELLCRRALAIDEKSFGPDHPKVALQLNNLGRLLARTNRIDEAELLYLRALAICEKSGSDHRQLATVLNNLALLLKATKRPDEAEPL